MLICFFAFSSAYIADDELVDLHPMFSHGWAIKPKVLIDDKIYLLNNQAKESRVASHRAHIPAKNWSIELSFDLNKEDKDSNIGIWLVKPNEKKNGTIFGGPEMFIGHAILIQNKQGNIGIQHIKSNSLTKAENFFKPSYNFAVTSPVFDLKITNSTDGIEIALTCDNIERKIYSGKDLTTIKHYTLFVTSQSNEHPATVRLLSSSFVSENSKIIKPPIQVNRQKDKFDNSVDIIDMFSYLSDVLNDSITGTDLNILIYDYFAPFTQSWQRRSIKISKKISLVHDSLNNELAVVKKQFKSFKKSIDDEFTHFTKKVVEIVQKNYFEVVSFEFVYGPKLNQFKEDVRRESISTFIFMLMMIEFLIAFVYGAKQYQDAMGIVPEDEEQLIQKK